MAKMNETIANRIKTVRKMKGMSQSDVARSLNIHPSTLSYYESAKRTIPHPVLMEMVALFDMSLDELMKGVGEQVGESEWIPLKRPLPLFSPTWVQRGLLALSLVLMVSAFLLGDETPFILGVLSLFVFGVTLTFSLYRHQKHKQTYIRLRPNDEPCYRFTEDETSYRRDSYTLISNAAMLLVALFFMVGIMLNAFADSLNEIDEAIFVIFFVTMSAVLITVIVQGFRKRRIGKIFPHHKASMTLGTLSLVCLQGFLAVGYVFHGDVLLQTLILGDHHIGGASGLFILFVHMVFIGMFGLFKNLHFIRLKYEFSRSME